jgi:putative redox protein
MTFTGAAGAQLAGLIRQPDGPVVGSAVLAHCFTCGKDLHTVSRLARRMTEAGWLTLTFDFTGIGGSEGDFVDTTVGTEVGDITRASVALLERNAGPCLLIGHSLGGAAAALAAHRLHTVSELVLIGTPADTEHVKHLFHGSVPDDDGHIEVTIGGRAFKIGRPFLDQLEADDVTQAVGELAIPVLVVAAGADIVVGADQTDRVAAAAKDGTLVTITGADHLFSHPIHAAVLADEIIAWLNTRRSHNS